MGGSTAAGPTVQAWARVIICGEFCMHSPFLYRLPPSSPVPFPKQTGWRTGYIQFAPPSMNVCTQVWCPVTDWHFIQNVFLSHAYCYQDGLRLYRDPDQVKVIEDEWTNCCTLTAFFSISEFEIPQPSVPNEPFLHTHPCKLSRNLFTQRIYYAWFSASSSK